MKGPGWFIVTLQEPCRRAKPWRHRLTVVVHAASARQANIRAKREWPLCMVWEGSTIQLRQRTIYTMPGEATKRGI